jgi:hypothetical protein
VGWDAQVPLGQIFAYVAAGQTETATLPIVAKTLAEGYET